MSRGTDARFSRNCSSHYFIAKEIGRLKGDPDYVQQASEDLKQMMSDREKGDHTNFDHFWAGPGFENLIHNMTVEMEELGGEMCHALCHALCHDAEYDYTHGFWIPFGQWKLGLAIPLFMGYSTIIGFHDEQLYWETLDELLQRNPFWSEINDLLIQHQNEEEGSDPEAGGP